jgi:uncharacterized protein YndB with AHSA1/START domain
VTVRVERIIPVRPHQVYRAWLEPELIRPWMSPGWEDVLAKLAAVAWPAVH